MLLNPAAAQFMRVAWARVACLMQKTVYDTVRLRLQANYKWTIQDYKHDYGLGPIIWSAS